VNDQARRRWSDGFDDDATFADIVAHLNDDFPEIERPARPTAADAAPDLDTTSTSGEKTTDPAAGTTADSAAGPGPESARESTDLPPGGPQPLPAPLVWRAHEVNDEYEEHFEPPPVTPLPAGDLAFWAILVGMAGGPLLLLYLVFFNRDASGYWVLTAIAMSVGGFALLVARLPGKHEEGDDGSRL
jgi:hypothetical protein